MRILIADDDRISRRLLERTLQGLGHEVVAVADGSAALATLLQPGGPTIAILDWEMPGVDGLGVCRQIRLRHPPYVYVIMLTGRGHRDDMEAAIEAEVDDFLTKPFDSLELRARLRSGERVLILQADYLDAQEKLREQATHDGLTGLWNRGMVLERLTIELERGSRDRQPVSIAMADIDHFKSINDSHGHAAGDAVLREAAQRMRSVLRAYDGLARYGGEEFLMLLPGCDTESALEIAERARLAVASEPAHTEAAALAVTISVGIASTVAADVDPATLIAAADEALYRAKAKGRNRVECWQPQRAESR